MILAATDLKIDSCLLSPNQNEAKKLLKIKSVDALPLIVGFGYIKKETFKKKRERIELKEIVSYEYFGGKNER